MARRAQPKAPSYRVFLSHSHQDRWIACVLRDKIQGIGVDVWLDAFDLPGGAKIRERIKDGMRRSKECLILLSPASLRSDWVRHEAGVADGKGRWTTLVLLHVDKRKIPEPLRDLRDLSINEFDSYLSDLGRRAGADPRGQR